VLFVESVEENKAEMLKREVMTMIDFITKSRSQSPESRSEAIFSSAFVFRFFDTHSAFNVSLWQEFARRRVFAVKLLCSTESLNGWWMSG